MKQFLEKNFFRILAISIALLFLDISLFAQILREGETGSLRTYFIDVGQGDSELVILPDGAKLLIDGGPPNGRLVGELDKILGAQNRYLDLVSISHAQLDHFGGLLEVMKNYEIGAFIWSGRSNDIEAFAELNNLIQKKNIGTIVLAEGDGIRQNDSRVEVLAPNAAEREGKDLNDSSLVLLVRSEGAQLVFTGDVGRTSEERLARLLPAVDILKVPHHGSKYSSSENFLAALRPLLAFIEVGKNSYGHPTPEVLERLSGIGARVYRTDKNGTLKVEVKNGRAAVAPL